MHTSSITNIKLGGFTSKSCSGSQRNVLKSVMHVQSCCFEVVVVVVVVVALTSLSK